MAKKDEKEKEPKTVDEILARIRKRHERSTLIYEEDADQVPVYRTRFDRLNRLLGGKQGQRGEGAAPGLRAGGIVELSGPEDSGKTSAGVALVADIQAQAPRGRDRVLMLNYEGPQPWKWWRQLGLDTSPARFTQLRPKSLEEGVGDAADLLETGKYCSMLIDSVYAAEAKEGRRLLKQWATSEGKGAGLGVEARQWGKAWTGFKGIIQDNDVVAIAVNQIREVIDTSGRPKKGFHGPQTTTPRGRALKFYAWVRIEMRKALFDREGRALVDGIRTRMKVIKNKSENGGRGMVEYDLIRGFGFDLLNDLLDLSLEAGVIQGKGGGNFVIGPRKLRGRDALYDLVAGSDKLQAVLRTHVERYLGSKTPASNGGEADDGGAGDEEGD